MTRVDGMEGREGEEGGEERRRRRRRRKIVADKKGDIEGSIRGPRGLKYHLLSDRKDFTLNFMTKIHATSLKSSSFQQNTKEVQKNLFHQKGHSKIFEVQFKHYLSSINFHHQRDPH